LQSGKVNEALADLDEAIKHLLLVRQRDARSLDAKRFLFASSCVRALTLGQLKRHRDALPDWDRAVELAPAVNRLLLRMSRADCLARAGEHAKAIGEARALARTRPPAAIWYELASVAALSASAAAGDLGRPLPWRERFAEQSAKQALAWLHAAHK